MGDFCMDEVYCIGHKNPDTDTTVAAMALSRFLNLKENTGRYKARLAGKVNTETEYVLSRFGA